MRTSQRSTGVCQVESVLFLSASPQCYDVVSSFLHKGRTGHREVICRRPLSWQVAVGTPSLAPLDPGSIFTALTLGCFQKSPSRDPHWPFASETTLSRTVEKNGDRPKSHPRAQRAANRPESKIHPEGHTECQAGDRMLTSAEGSESSALGKGATKETGATPRHDPPGNSRGLSEQRNFRSR